MQRYDVVIVGGSYAGLAAALQLGRARRTVLVVDAQKRRNRFVAAAHGFLTNDGASPDSIAARGKAEALAYSTVHWKDAFVTETRATGDGFLVRAGDEEFAAKRVILATGVVDELPSIPGAANLWGKRVFHCPYCDGYELGRPALGVLATNLMSAHYVQLVSEWGAPGRTTFLLNRALELNPEQTEQLARRRITVEEQAIVELREQGGGLNLLLADGRTLAMAALFVMANGKLPGPFAEQLGLQTDTAPTGTFYKTDASRETNVPGVFACGDAAAPHGAISFAVGDGVRAGFSAHQSLVFRPDTHQPVAQRAHGT